MSLKVCINPDCQKGISHDHQYQDDCQNDGRCVACGQLLPASHYSSEDASDDLDTIIQKEK